MTGDGFAPEPTALTEDFWDATRRRSFLLQWCEDCKRPIYYPRYACPRCLGAQLSWQPSEGEGVIYSFTVVHVRSVPWMDDRIPYVVVLIDLAEGVRVLSNLVCDDPDSVHVGMPVRLDWMPLPDGRALPIFCPA